VRRELAALLLIAAMVCGCESPAEQPPPGELSQSNTSPTTNPAPADVIVATVRGHDVTMSELQGPLIQAYGLNMLLEVVQLDLVEQDAQRENITVSDADVEAEGTRTLIDFRKASHQDEVLATTNPSAAGGASADDDNDTTLSPVERDKQLNMLLTGQHLTRTEFELAMRRNALLRKLVQPQVQAHMTDDLVRERFNAIYGEKAHVRFIRLPDMLAVSNVERALQDGHTFDEEVRQHAYDSIGRASAGEVPPFGRKDMRYPAEFRMVAFDLKPGQISDPLQIKDSIYLVQLIELIPPQHAVFDDYKDSVRRDLYEQLVQEGIKQYITNLGTVARQTIEIKDPELNRQWNDTLRNANELREQLRQQQEAATSQPAAESAPDAGSAPATAPAAGN